MKINEEMKRLIQENEEWAQKLEVSTREH